MPPPLKPQITTQQEELLWERKILNLQSSSGLIQAVIFYLIKSCGVYQGKDLRQLKTEHVKFGEDSVGHYVTIDFSSVVMGGKFVRHYDDPNNPRSLYKLLKTYIRYLANEGAFLVRPISSIKDYICYSPWPLGVSIIEHTVQTLMEEAGQGSRYGNISAILLALDVLKSYGAGHHCLSAWVDCLAGASLCYKAKVFNGKIPDCTTVNCRDLNAEAGLIMSHLLDPPYPSNGSATQDDIKITMDESEVIDSERSVSNASIEMTQSKGSSRVVRLNTNSLWNKDRSRVVNGGGIRRLVGGAGSNLQKKQAMLMRFRSRDSQKLRSRNQTAQVDVNSENTEIKSEPQADEDIPDVEIDLAADLQLDSNMTGEEDLICNGDIEEAPGDSVLTGKRNQELKEGEISPEKIPKIEQHFQELQATFCSSPVGLEDRVEQREDVTVDTTGEETEDFMDNTDEVVDSHTPRCTGPSGKFKSLKKGQDESQSPKKLEHLSLVEGLEKWLGTLKHRVNSGSDPDMNGLLLQATSQLKVIADKVIASKEETRSNAPKKFLANQAMVKADMNSCGQNIENNSFNQPASVQQKNSLQTHQSELSSLALEEKHLSLSPLKSSMVDIDGLVKTCDFPVEKLTTLGKSETNHSSGLMISLSSPENGGTQGIDLSPPVLSPQPRTEVEDNRNSFLFSHLSQERKETCQTSTLENRDKNKLLEISHSDPSKGSSVPDLVKFVESANLQVQSLLSTPTSPFQINSESEQPNRTAKSTEKDSGIFKSSSASKVSAALALSTDNGSSSDTQTLSNQSTSGSLQSQSSLSWPLLRSVLEEALPSQTMVAAEKLSPALPRNLDCNNGSITGTTNSDAVLKSSTSTTLSDIPLRQSLSPQLAAQTGMYTFHSDHSAGAAFQALTVVSGDKRSRVFTFPDLPLDKGGTQSHSSGRTPTASGGSAAQAVRNARSELCLGDYLPRGACIPASSIKVVTQQGSNGLEVVLRFDFAKSNSDAKV